MHSRMFPTKGWLTDILSCFAPQEEVTGVIVVVVIVMKNITFLWRLSNHMLISFRFRFRFWATCFTAFCASIALVLWWEKWKKYVSLYVCLYVCTRRHRHSLTFEMRFCCCAFDGDCSPTSQQCWQVTRHKALDKLCFFSSSACVFNVGLSRSSCRHVIRPSLAIYQHRCD